jgi:large subunit ribosomal protein L4
MSSLPVFDSEGKRVESVELPDDMFGEDVNTDVIHQAVVMYQASLRQGNASTKERGAVSGGGKKPFRQKGTGRARQGSIRSPLWKGGGVVFGPHPRDFGYTVPQKVRKTALRESLKAKHKSEDMVCVDDLKNSFDKTKEFAQILKNLSLKGNILALLDGSDASIVRVSRNIPFFRLMRSRDVSAYDILRHKKILVTKTALSNLMERIRQ